METKAHDVLIGAFTLAVMVLIVLFALWLPKISLDRQYHRYDVVFTEAVTGLTRGSPVRYSGIQIGEVSQLRLDTEDPRKVLARIRVNADSPIKTDTRAKLSQLGLTGVAFVQLTGGAPGSASLLPGPNNPVPLIPSERSTLAKLLDSSDGVMTALNGVLARLDQVVSQGNVEHIDHTLANLEQTTSTLAAEREDIRTLIRQAAAASKQLNLTLTAAHTLVDGPGKQTLESAQMAMASLQDATHTLNALLAQNHDSLQSGLRGVDQIGPALRELRTTLHDIRQVTSKLQENPAGYLLSREQPVKFTPKP